MRESWFRRIRHTTINILHIAMIVALNYVMSSGMSAVPALSSEIKYRTSDRESIAMECVIAWDGQYLNEILSTLRIQDTRISFVLSGSWAQSNPDMLRRIVSDGHGIITCGMNYEDTANLNASKLAESIELSVELIKGLCEVDITQYFCPTDDTSKAMKAASKVKVQCVRCTVDLLAARGDDEDIVRRAEAAASPGAIIAFTPTQAMTKALPEVIATYRNSGFDIIGIQ